MTGPAGVHDALTMAAECASEKWCARFVTALRNGLDHEAAKAQALPHLKLLGSIAGDDSAADLVYVQVGA